MRAGNLADLLLFAKAFHSEESQVRSNQWEKCRHPSSMGKMGKIGQFNRENRKINRKSNKIYGIIDKTY